MPTPSDVLVVGGGMIGSASAWALAEAGARVTVLQRPEQPGEAWTSAAGMLAAQIESRPDDPLLDLALAGRGFYVRNAAPLQELTGIDLGLIQCGIIQVARSPAAAQRYKEKVANHRQRSHQADWLEPAEVAHGWPWLAPTLGAFWSPQDGAVDPGMVVRAFRRAAADKGVTTVHDTAVALDREGGQLRGVIGMKGKYPGAHVVLAGGAWSGQIAQLPRPLSVEPVRGQMISFDWPKGVPPAIVYGEHGYLLCRGDELLVGATMEHVGFDIATTAQGLDTLRRQVSLIYPDIDRLSLRRHWAGLRPGSPDGLPIIGAEPRLPGLWYATGHGRNGVLLAGVTGELLARAIAGDDVSETLRPVRPTRFWDW